MRTANMENAKFDGVNSIKYHIKEFERKNTFTRILVELDPKEVSPKFNRIFSSAFQFEPLKYALQSHYQKGKIRF